MPAEGTLTLHIRDQAVGEGKIKTQPGKFSIAGEGLNIGREGAEPVTDDYPGEYPWRFVGGTIEQAAIDVSGQPFVDLAEEARMAFALIEHQSRYLRDTRRQSRSAGVYEIPTMLPSGDSVRATVCPHGSCRAPCSSSQPALCNSSAAAATASGLATSNSILACGTGRSAGHSGSPKHACGARARGQTPEAPCSPRVPRCGCESPDPSSGRPSRSTYRPRLAGSRIGSDHCGTPVTDVNFTIPTKAKARNPEGQCAGRLRRSPVTGASTTNRASIRRCRRSPERGPVAGSSSTFSPPSIDG